MSLAERLASIGITRDYSEIDFTGIELDLQGWGHDHPIFERVMAESPTLVIEVGSWKGASLARMHSLSPATTFICVDTWLGSASHWLAEEIPLRCGHPDLYRQFVFNVLELGADVYPLPMTSVTAAAILGELGVLADVVYIDAGHEEIEVAADLEGFWPLLRGGGVMFGDDYHERWPGVVSAVDRFAPEREVDGAKWLIRKGVLSSPAAL